MRPKVSIAGIVVQGFGLVSAVVLVATLANHLQEVDPGVTAVVGLCVFSLGILILVFQATAARPAPKQEPDGDRERWEMSRSAAVYLTMAGFTVLLVPDPLGLGWGLVPVFPAVMAVTGLVLHLHLRYSCAPVGVGDTGSDADEADREPPQPAGRAAYRDPWALVLLIIVCALMASMFFHLEGDESVTLAAKAFMSSEVNTPTDDAPTTTTTTTPTDDGPTTTTTTSPTTTTEPPVTDPTRAECLARLQAIAPEPVAGAWEEAFVRHGSITTCPAMDRDVEDVGGYYFLRPRPTSSGFEQGRYIGHPLGGGGFAFAPLPQQLDELYPDGNLDQFGGVPSERFECLGDGYLYLAISPRTKVPVGVAYRPRPYTDTGEVHLYYISGRMDFPRWWTATVRAGVAQLTPPGDGPSDAPLPDSIEQVLEYC